MTRPFSVFKTDDDSHIQKYVKMNDMVYRLASPHLMETQSKLHTIALLENLRSVANALLFQLRAQQQMEELHSYNSQTQYTQDIFNTLKDVAPIVPKIEDQTHYSLYSETPENATNVSSNASPRSTENIINSTETMAPVKNEFVSQEREEVSPKQVTKPAQSKFKNCYGLVVGRVIRSVKEYLRLMRQQKLKGMIGSSQYNYIHQRIGHFSDSEFERFENYLKEYHTRSANIKKNRGKSTVYKYLEQDISQGLVLVELVQTFLENDNSDFQSYIRNETKPKKQVSHVLSDEKNVTQLRNAFKEMQYYLEKATHGVKHEF